MDTAAWLETTLEEVVGAVGDPAPLLYGKLFARWPELLPMFVGDKTGSVRAEMFLRALDTLADLAAGRHHAQGMIAAERANHAMLGVGLAQFDGYFSTLGEVFREALGAKWTAGHDAHWQHLLGQVRAIEAHSSGA